MRCDLICTKSLISLASQLHQVRFPRDSKPIGGYQQTDAQAADLSCVALQHTILRMTQSRPMFICRLASQLRRALEACAVAGLKSVWHAWRGFSRQQALYGSMVSSFRCDDRPDNP